eukprot:CAMPEP_0168203642 /NCGR_PEP_ID=MMETSP0139_2-20121125/24965_1 /TAXON_ID=44445 /ORGANISM="Pseudo-nitzschia australis, Strain 10249 10 AB" /LENGTH=159 /DNA_ID=CAMNT_0008129511 /DNA_START=98 /DNA_END=577 /DNA_ORIENTATION=+
MSNFTTNEGDQRDAANLQARLKKSAGDDDGDDKDKEVDNATAYQRIPNVTIAEGKHKYVLMSALLPGSGERQNFVVSRAFADYHCNVAEPMAEALERSGYKSISITGGGRIALDTDKRSVFVYGFSYGFGLADHALSVSVVQSDERYKDYEVTWSNEGY